MISFYYLYFSILSPGIKQFMLRISSLVSWNFSSIGLWIMDFTCWFILKHSLYLELLSSFPLISHQKYTWLNIHHCIATTFYCKKKSYCFQKRKQVVTFILERQQPLYTDFITTPFFFFFILIHSLEIRFWNLSLSVNETTRLLPENWQGTKVDMQSQKSLTPVVWPCGKPILPDTRTH